MVYTYMCMLMQRTLIFLDGIIVGYFLLEMFLKVHVHFYVIVAPLVDDHLTGGPRNASLFSFYLVTL